MNAERLLAHYNRAADAPDAIPNLRRFILNLAVRGKLVPQEPKDDPALELVKRIEVIKARLAAAGKIRNGKLSLPIGDEQLPCSIPSGWSWLRLNDIGIVSGGMTPSMNRADFWDGDIVWLSPKDIKSDEVSDSELKITTNALKETRLEAFRPGSIFIVARSGILKRTLPVAINRITAAANQDMKVLVPFVPGLERYLQIMFRGLTDFILRELVKTGTTVQSLRYAEFEQQPFPLPPVAEQERIVAKVDELMTLCDRLEAARAERETTRNRLAAASLTRLDAPDPDPAVFANDARFAVDNVAALTTRDDQIKQLRQTLLNLAVRGGLSARDTWQAVEVRLGDVAKLQNGYAFKSEWFAKSGMRLLRNANVGHGNLNWDDEVRLPESRASEYERFRLVVGDVVLSLDRPFIVTGTKVARVKSQDLPALLLQRVGRFILSEALSPEYLYLWINSPHFSQQINPGRSNGVPHISSKQVEAAMLFVPSLAEQHRIVAKVDELMAVCDWLEASLAAGDDARSRLLDALLVEALAPARDVAEAA